MDMTTDRIDLADGQRGTGEIVKSIINDTQALVRKEVELAKVELMEAAASRAKAAAAAAVAGVVALYGLGFLASAAAAGLATVVPTWLARLIVAIVFFLIGGVALLFGRKMASTPFAPEETLRRVKEDVEWAKAQLRR